MPGDKSDSILKLSDYESSTNFEKRSAWVSLIIGLAGLIGGGAVFLLGILRTVSWSSALGVGVAISGLCFVLSSIYFNTVFSRRMERRFQEVVLERLDKQVAEARVEVPSRFGVDEDSLRTLVRESVHVGTQEVLESLETAEPGSLESGSLSGRIEEERELASLSLDVAANEVATTDRIGRLKALLDDLADRDDIAMRASLERSDQVIRGQPTNSCEYRVWFGTDRRLKVDGDFARGFTDEFSDTFRCGSCVVFIPKSHEFGSIGSTPIVRIWKKVTGQPTDAKLKLLAIEAGTSESFVGDLRASLSQLPEGQRDLVLFIHGYNVDFESAAIRAAQVGRDLELPGPMVFYSWPSKATLPGYSADEATIDRTLPKFRDFLNLLIAIPEASAVNVIAHSMGNRLLQRAMQLFAERNDPEAKRFGHVVLAAPDIDRDTFRQAAADYARLKANPDRRTTVYFNKSDFAVSISGWIHQESRAGTLGKAFAATDSILWIDKWFRLDWLGHGYFASAEPVLRDIQNLLVRNQTPEQRKPALNPIPSDVPQYWELRA